MTYNLKNVTAYTVEMPIEQWYQIQDNPVQRDIETHWNRSKHFQKLMPNQIFVAAAELPNGDLIKVDGHCRVFQEIQ